MKKLLLLNLLLIALSSTAQIGEPVRQPEKIKIGEAGNHSLSYYLLDGDTVFYLLFRNNEYSSIVDYRSITFKGGFADLDVLYNAIVSVFLPENKKNKEYSISLPVGEDTVRITPLTMAGATSALIFADRGHFGLSERMAKKLFAKDKKK